MWGFESEPVDDRGRQPGSVKVLAPFGEGCVGGADHGGAFLPDGDHLEQQSRAARIKG
jgi:hypothetical protein